MWGIWGGQLFEWGVPVPRSAPAVARARETVAAQAPPDTPHTCTPATPSAAGRCGLALIRPRSMRGGTMSSYTRCARDCARHWCRRRREFERRLEQHREHVLLVEQVRLHVR